MYDEDNAEGMHWDFFSSEAWKLFRLGTDFIHAFICGLHLSALWQWIFFF